MVWHNYAACLSGTRDTPSQVPGQVTRKPAPGLHRENPGELPEIDDEILASYEQLPHDPYMGNGTRYKRFSQYRLTWDGQYIHAAPWSTSAQGSYDVSHGCTNISMDNAKWLYGIVHIGDAFDGTCHQLDVAKSHAFNAAGALVNRPRAINK